MPPPIRRRQHLGLHPKGQTQNDCDPASRFKYHAVGRVAQIRELSDCVKIPVQTVCNSFETCLPFWMKLECGLLGTTWLLGVSQRLRLNGLQAGTAGTQAILRATLRPASGKS